MGVSPTRQNGTRSDRFASKFDKKKRNKLQKDATTEIREAKQKLRKNIHSYSWWSKFIQLASIIVFYFSSSIALTFYQKDLLKILPFPLTIVVCHLFLKFCLAAFCRQVYGYIYGYWKNEAVDERVVLPWKLYLQRVLLVAATSALDIGLSQWSFEYITVALYTMTKTTSILFILGFGLALGLEKKHWSQIIIVILISIGLIMFTFKSTTFSMIGFVLALSGSFLSGARWTFSQMIMQKSSIGLENPIDLMYHIQPLMILTLLPIAIGIEGVDLAASRSGFLFESTSDIRQSIIGVGIGGTLAFAMEVAEFAIVQIASSLTLSIIGVTKEVVSVTISIVRNGRQLLPVNIVGMVICLSGIAAHVVRKATESPPKNNTKQSKLSNNSQSNYSILSQSTSESSDEEIFLNIARETALGKSKKSIPSSENCDKVTSQPLLWDENESEFSSEEETFQLHSLNRTKDNALQNHKLDKERTWKSVDDDFFLRDNRAWTSVKDMHVKMLSDSSAKAEEVFVDNKHTSENLQEEVLINTSET